MPEDRPPAIPHTLSDSAGMKFLFLGDIVGKPGMNAVLQNAQRIRDELDLDYVIANAENASDGSGLMPKQFERLIDSGIDGVTLGDHIYRRKEIVTTLEKSDRIVKPANYPDEASGRRWTLIKRSGRRPLWIVRLTPKRRISWSGRIDRGDQGHGGTALL